MVKSIKLFMGAIVAMSLVAGGAVIAHGEEYFKDKTIFFVVGYSPGGSFDAYTRLIAQARPRKPHHDCPKHDRSRRDDRSQLYLQ